MKKRNLIILLILLCPLLLWPSGQQIKGQRIRGLYPYGPKRYVEVTNHAVFHDSTFGSITWWRYDSLSGLKVWELTSFIIANPNTIDYWVCNLGEGYFELVIREKGVRLE